jgi:hypothetical protein
LRNHHNAKLLRGTQHFSDTQIVGPSGSYDRLPAIRDTGRFLEKIQDFGYTQEPLSIVAAICRYNATTRNWPGFGWIFETLQ